MSDPVSETLNPSNAALLLIDHQVGTMNAEPIGKILGARVPNFGFVAAGFNHRPAK